MLWFPLTLLRVRHRNSLFQFQFRCVFVIEGRRTIFFLSLWYKNIENKMRCLHLILFAMNSKPFFPLPFYVVSMYEQNETNSNSRTFPIFNIIYTNDTKHSSRTPLARLVKWDTDSSTCTIWRKFYWATVVLLWVFSYYSQAIHSQSIYFLFWSKTFHNLIPNNNFSYCFLEVVGWEEWHVNQFYVSDDERWWCFTWDTRTNCYVFKTVQLFLFAFYDH